MAEQYEKVLNINAEELHKRLQNEVIEDTKENAKAHKEEAIFMGKVAAKKFYILYKPQYMRFYNYMTVLRGDVSATEDGRARLRYRFSKFKGAVVLSSILLIAVTALAIYAFITNATNFAGNACILGFWALAVCLYMYSMASTRAARDRLVDFIDQLAKR